MKKQLVSILTAGCLMAAMVPAAFAADTNDLQAQINAAQAGSTITLSENTTITEPLVIDHSAAHVRTSDFKSRMSCCTSVICPSSL